MVLKAGRTASKEELRGYLETRVAKWWLPDDVAYVEALPHMATGKLQKNKLHEPVPGLSFIREEMSRRVLGNRTCGPTR